MINGLGFPEIKTPEKNHLDKPEVFEASHNSKDNFKDKFNDEMKIRSRVQIDKTPEKENNNSDLQPLRENNERSNASSKLRVEEKNSKEPVLVPNEKAKPLEEGKQELLTRIKNLIKEKLKIKKDVSLENLGLNALPVNVLKAIENILKSLTGGEAKNLLGSGGASSALSLLDKNPQLANELDKQQVVKWLKDNFSQLPLGDKEKNILAQFLQSTSEVNKTEDDKKKIKIASKTNDTEASPLSPNKEVNGSKPNTQNTLNGEGDKGKSGSEQNNKNGSSSSTNNDGIRFSLPKESLGQITKTYENSAQSMDHRQILGRLVHQIKSAVTKGENQLVMKLYPEHLGKVVVTLTREDGLYTAKLVVDNLAIKELIESRMQDFKDHLNNTGATFTHVDVDVRDQKDNKTNEENVSNGIKGVTEKNKEVEDGQNQSTSVRANKLGLLDLVA